MPKPNYKLKKFLTCISSTLETIYEEQDNSSFLEKSRAKNDSE
jgi:hypothetical protein